MMDESHKGCRFLDYDEGKYDRCTLIKNADGFWWWEREAPYPGAVTAIQFCQKRGRINQKGNCWEPGFLPCYEAQDS